MLSGKLVIGLGLNVIITTLKAPFADKTASKLTDTLTNFPFL